MSSTVVSKNPKEGKKIKKAAVKFDNVTGQNIDALSSAFGQMGLDENKDGKSPWEKAPVRMFKQTPKEDARISTLQKLEKGGMLGPDKAFGVRNFNDEILDYASEKADQMVQARVKKVVQRFHDIRKQKM